MIGVIIVARPGLLRDGIEAILKESRSFSVIGSGVDIRMCAPKPGGVRADMVFVEAGLVSGSDLDFFLGAQVYGAFATVVLLGGKTDREDIQGERVSLDISGSDLVTKLESLVQDLPSPGRTKRRDRPFGLSAREYEVAQLVTKGLTNADIGHRIGIKEQSVKNVVSCVLERLGVKNRTAIAIALLSAAE